jgi:hypothetical protein
VNRIDHHRHDVAFCLQQSDGLQIAGELLHVGSIQKHRQQPAHRMWPGFLGDLEFVDRVTTPIERVRADEKNEEIRFLDSAADTAVELVARREVLAIEEQVVSLLGERHPELLGDRAILGRVTQENFHFVNL